MILLVLEDLNKHACRQILLFQDSWMDEVVIEESSSKIHVQRSTKS